VRDSRGATKEFVVFRRRRGVIFAAPLVVAALFPATTGATSTGGCPAGGDWELVTVASLNITPEEAMGLPSLDGNGDGLTCINRLPNHPLIVDAFVFRDNTVGP
jgi:hypothetical protein